MSLKLKWMIALLVIVINLAAIFIPITLTLNRQYHYTDRWNGYSDIWWLNRPDQFECHQRNVGSNGYFLNRIHHSHSKRIKRTDCERWIYYWRSGN